LLIEREQWRVKKKDPSLEIAAKQCEYIIIVLKVSCFNHDM